jgi:hypothetical protein
LHLCAALLREKLAASFEPDLDLTCALDGEPWRGHHGHEHSPSRANPVSGAARPQRHMVLEYANGPKKETEGWASPPAQRLSSETFDQVKASPSTRTNGVQSNIIHMYIRIQRARLISMPVSSLLTRKTPGKKTPHVPPPQDQKRVKMSLPHTRRTTSLASFFSMPQFQHSAKCLIFTSQDHSPSFFAQNSTALLTRQDNPYQDQQEKKTPLFLFMCICNFPSPTPFRLFAVSISEITA